MSKIDRGARAILWLLLLLPAIVMIWPVAWGDAEYRHVLQPSGEFSAQLIIVALSITPLRRLIPGSRPIAWLAARRRQIGVAAFCYAALHLVFFVMAIGRIDYILQGLAFASMWTGWLAFLLLAPLAVTSNDAAMRRLKRGWKTLHRLAYPAAILALAHWLMLGPSAWEALAWFAPLGVLQAARFVSHMADRHKKKNEEGSAT